MTPPDSDIPTQTRRHIGPLVGIGVALVLGFGFIFFWLLDATDEDVTPAAEETQELVPRTGNVDPENPPPPPE